MRILTLIIKQKYFDEIIAGRKKEEVREITPSNARKYVKVDKDGVVMVDEETEHTMPREYDAIRLYVGYHEDRDTALIKVTGARVEFLKTPEGEIIIEDDESNWVYETIHYSLGEIIEKKVKPRSR